MMQILFIDDLVCDAKFWDKILNLGENKYIEAYLEICNFYVHHIHYFN